MSKRKPNARQRKARRLAKAFAEAQAEQKKREPSAGAIDYIAEKMCINKKIYHGSGHATRDAHSMSIRFNEKLVSYKCPFCGSFHVGHAVK